MRTEQRLRSMVSWSTWTEVSVLALVSLLGAIALPVRPLQAQTRLLEMDINEATPSPTVDPATASDSDWDEQCQPVGRSGARACRVQSGSGEESPEPIPSVGQATLPFSDVPLDHWAYDALLFLSSP